MKHKITFLIAAVSIFCLSTLIVQAQTITTKSVTQESPPPGGQVIKLGNFDLNKDGILSTFEVGEMLFKFFDTNTDGALDSMEYEHKTVLTVVPMEKEVTVTYDYDNDGAADATQRTFETFTQDTHLARFDTNKDGLSPHDFVDQEFSTVDTDGNRSADLVEWRKAYLSKITVIPAK